MIENSPTGRSEKDSLLFQLGVAAAIVCSLVLIFELFVAIYRSPDVFGEIYDLISHILIITPSPVSILALTGTAVQAFYVIVLISVILAVGYILFRFIPVLISFFRNGETESLRKSAMFEFGTVFAAIYFLQTAFIIVLMAVGVDIESTIPFQDETDLEMMFLTLQASVWEEIVSRVLLIGFPMLLIALIRSDREKWWKWLTGGFGMSQYAAALIILSAVFFGLAHVPGWDLWKFIPTFMFGLGVGYMFVKYGLYAAISMHFIFNYLSASDWLLNDGGAMLGLAVLITALFGIPFVWVYLKRGISYLREEFIRA